MAERAEHQWVVDGVEEGMARVEEDGERMLAVPTYLLPAGVVEGDVLRVTRGPEKKRESVTLVVTINVEAAARAMARSKDQTARTAAASKKRDPGGDVAL